MKDTGSVTFTDADLTDTHTAHVAYNNDATGAAVSPALAAALATALTVPSSALAAGDHDFNWNFALDNSLIQYLAEGETITATYTITVEDNSGGTNDTSTAKTVTVTITGTNDAPVITSSASAATATVAELPDVTGSPLPDQAGGTVTFGDVDLTDTHQVTQSALNFTWDGGGLTPTQIADLVAASARTLTPHDSTGTGSGSVDWTYKITDSALDFLARGQTLTVKYDIAVADYHNGVALGTSTTQTVTVIYTGANDAPVVSGTVANLLVVEDGLSSTLDALANASDVDNGATLSVVNVPGVDAPGSLPAGVTYNAGDHTFTLDPSNAAYQHLAEGVTTTVTVNYGVSDGIVTTPTPGSVSWTITGTNDAPTVAAALTDTASEGAVAFTKNLLLDASDADDGETATLSLTNVTYKVDTAVASSIIPAGLSLGTDGHTLTIDPTDASFDHLAVGESTTIVVNYDIKDVHDAIVHQTETITINGTNDAPVVSGAVLATVTENGDTSTLDALANASDVDDGHTLSVVNVPNTLPAGVTYDADDHTFTLDPTDPAYQSLANGHTTLVTVDYGVSDGIVTTPTPGSVSWTITGTNDAPTINTSGFQIAESSGTTTISNLSVADPDTGDTFTVTATADHGTVAVSPNSGNLAAVNGALGTGIAYTPTGTPATDKITLTVTDATGAHDTVNFIFNVAGTGPVTLQGTSQKDVFFATGYQDTFVFAPSSNQDIITGGFQSGVDKIDLQALTSFDATALTALLAHADHIGSDTLLHLNGNTDTLLVKGVAALNANDFILHA